MKKLLLLSALALGTVLPASAVTYSFQPGDYWGSDDLNDLDHRFAYTWGIQFQVPAGMKIESVTLSIADIWNWAAEDNALFIHLLDDPKKGPSALIDPDSDAAINDYFLGQGIELLTWVDLPGGVDTGFDLVHEFTADQIAVLEAYLSDPRASGDGDFGFGFDPDCHYFNNGITLTVTVPDGGSTLMFLGLALLAIPGLRRLRRS
jgi:hypothetical protein